MLVRDVMHPGLIACTPETRLGQAAALLSAHRIHALIVADSDGRPMGMLSDTDLLAGEWLSTDEASLSTMRSLTAAELMSTPLATIDADADAEEAAARMRRDRLSRLVVIDDDVAVGVVAISDFVRSLARMPAERSTVADVMSWAIVTCLAQTPLPAAARAMDERRSRSIVVVDRSGSPVGVLTGFDLLAAYDGGALAGTVEDHMHPPLTIGPQASLRDAADQMLTHEVHRLVVVDPEDRAQIPLGLISTSDIVAEMAAPDSVWQAG
jgi:CBS domain-containing protein